MLTTEDRVITQLLGTIYLDKSDKTMYRINMDNALKILISSGFIIPVKQFEATLEALLNKKLVGNATIDHSTKYVIAKAIFTLAQEMSVSKDAILKYQLMSKEDVLNKKD